MGIDFTSTALIKTIKDDALLPNSQITYSDQDLVDILSRELLSDIVPMIMSVREEYMVFLVDQPIVTTVNKYMIPTRAIGEKLRDVVLVDANGFEIKIPRLEPEYTKGLFVPLTLFTGFFFQDDQIVFYPDTSTLGAYTLRMKIFRRPNNIILTSKSGQITAINSNAVTVGNVPTTWTIDTDFDVIQGIPPFRAWGEDQEITSIIGNVVTFSSLPTGTAVGDWISESGFSPIAQIPYEIFPLLCQRGVIKILSGLGDANGLKEAADIYKDMVDKFKIMVTPRADGSPKRLVSNGGVFRSSRSYNLFGR